MAKRSKKAGASTSASAGGASSGGPSADADAAVMSEFRIPKKKRPAPATANSDEPAGDGVKLNQPANLDDRDGGAAACAAAAASGPSRKRRRTASSRGGGGGSGRHTPSKRKTAAHTNRSKSGIRPAPARPPSAGSPGAGGVLLGHRILRPFPHVRRVKRGKKHVEEDCEALFLGTVVKYHRPDAGGSSGTGKGGGRSAQVLVAKRIAADGTRTDEELICHDDKGPLDVGLYRVRFDDGDVTDLEPTEIYAGAMMYQKERVRRLAAASAAAARGGGSVAKGKHRSKSDGDGGEVAIIVGCCAFVAPHHKHQPSEERGVTSLLDFANPPMDYGTPSGRQIVAALDEEMQAYWEAYESFHREEGIKRPALLSKRANSSHKSVGWGWEEDDGDDDAAAAAPAPASGIGMDNTDADTNVGDSGSGKEDNHGSGHIEDKEAKAKDDSVGGGTSRSRGRAEERVMSQNLLPKELRDEDHAVVIVEGPRKRKKTAAYSDATPEDPACWNSLVRGHNSSDDGDASDDGDGGGGGRRSAPLSIGTIHQLSKVIVGCRISIFWPDDDDYYPGRVTGRDPESNRIFRVMYDDGRCETLDLGKEKFRVLKGGNKSKKMKKQRKMPSTSDREDEDADEDGDYDQDGENDDIVCPFCTKSFKKKSGLSSHLNTCKVKAEIEGTVAAGSDNGNDQALQSKYQDHGEKMKKEKAKSKTRKPERRKVASKNKITPQTIVEDGKLMAMRASIPRKRKQTKSYTDGGPVDEACTKALVRHRHSSDEDSDSSSDDGNSNSSDSEIEMPCIRRGEGIKGPPMGKKSLLSGSKHDDDSDSESDSANEMNSVAGQEANNDNKQKDLCLRPSVVPSDDRLRLLMKELMFEVDLNTISYRQFTVKLSKSLGGIDLSSKKAFIKEALTNMVVDMDVGGVKSAASAPEDDSINQESSNTQRQNREGPPSLGKQPRYQREAPNGGAEAVSICGADRSTNVQGDHEVEQNSVDDEGSSMVQKPQCDVKWMSVRYFSESGGTDSEEEEEGRAGGDPEHGLSAVAHSHNSGNDNNIDEEKKEETDASTITGKESSSCSDDAKEGGREDRTGTKAAAKEPVPKNFSQSEQINVEEGVLISSSAGNDHEATPNDIEVAKSAKAIDNSKNQADSETGTGAENDQVQLHRHSQTDSASPADVPASSTGQKAPPPEKLPEAASAYSIDTADEADGESGSKEGDDPEPVDPSCQRLDQAADTTSTMDPSSGLSPAAEDPSSGTEEMKNGSASICASLAVDGNNAGSGLPTSDENQPEQTITPPTGDDEDQDAANKAEDQDEAKRKIDADSTKEFTAQGVASPIIFPDRKAEGTGDNDSSPLNGDADSIPRANIREEGENKEEEESCVSTTTTYAKLAKVDGVPTDPGFFERETPPIETSATNEDNTIEKEKTGDDDHVSSSPIVLGGFLQEQRDDTNNGGTSATRNGTVGGNTVKEDNKAVITCLAEKSETKTSSIPALDKDLKQSLSQLDDLLAFEDGEEDEEEEEECKEAKSAAYDGGDTPKRSGSSPTCSAHDNNEKKSLLPLQPAMRPSTHDKREASDTDIRNAERAVEDAIKHRLGSTGGHAIQQSQQSGSSGTTDRPNPLAKRCLSEELSVEGDEGEPEKKKKSRVPADGAKERKHLPIPDRGADQDSSSGEEEVLDEGAVTAASNNGQQDGFGDERGFYTDPNEEGIGNLQRSPSLSKRDEQSSLHRPRKTHSRDGSHVSFSFETQEYFEDEPFPSQRQHSSPRRDNGGDAGHAYTHATLSPSRAVESPRRHYHSALSPIIKTPATPNHRWGASSFDHGLQPETPGAILAAIETPNPQRAGNGGAPLLGLNVPLIADQRTDHGTATQDGLDADISTDHDDDEDDDEEEEKVEIPEELKVASRKANDAAFDEILRKSPDNWTVGYASDSEEELTGK